MINFTLNWRELANFWAKVQKTGEEDCWEWLGSKRAGYGRVRLRGANYNATEVIMALKGEKRQGSALVLHSCDNRGCCNPRHLSWGTYSRNAYERAARNTDWYINRWKDLSPEEEMVLRAAHKAGGSLASL